MILHENSLRRAVLIVLALGAGYTTGRGEDRIESSAYSPEYLLYEPTVFEVRLILDEPFVIDPDDPEESLRQLRRLHRRFDAILLRSGATVQEFWLTSPDFQREDAIDGRLCAQVMGFVGKSDKRGQTFTHFEEPGIYEIVVRDLEHGVESQAVGVRLRAPVGDEIPAAQLFKKSFPGALMMILKQKADEKTIGCFERLASEYPETLYGKYAIVSLALIRWKETFRERNIKGGAQVWGPVAAELTKAAATFDGPHPLRGQALFDLARAQVWAGQATEARRTAQTLSTDFPTGELGHKGRQLLSELDTMGARNSQVVNTVQENSPE